MKCPNCDGPVPVASGSRQRVWCSDRCRKAAGRRGISPNGRDGDHDPPMPEDMRVTEALEAFLSVLEYPPEDPRSVVAAVARLLAAEVEQRPSAMIASELRRHLEHLGMFPNDEPGVVDELRARRAQRRVEMLLGRAGDDEESG